MKMLRLLAVLFTLLSARQPAVALCESDGVYVFPRTGNIAANSLFIIVYSERDFNYKNHLNEFIFQASNTHGFPVYLKPIQVNFSGSMGQIVLKPSRDFRLNDSVSLIVTIRDKAAFDQSKTGRFKSKIEWPRWKVKMAADKTPPEWKTEEVPYRFSDHRHSSVWGFGISFNCPVSDNSFPFLAVPAPQYGVAVYPILYEISFMGSRYISDANEFSISIYTSSCGRNFDIELNKRYTASFRPMDMSGNYCRESRVVQFDTTPPETD